MNRLSCFFVPVAFFASLAVACSGSPDEGFGESSDALINGQVAFSDQARSAMLLWPEGLPTWCTAVRVGPRHILTAAHCVVTESAGNLTATVMPNFASGKPLRVTRKAAVATAETTAFGTVAIAQTIVHPAWVAACAATGCPYGTILSTAIPDLAVIQTQTDLPSSIATAFVDTGFLSSGETVTVAGYGCENTVTASPNPRRLKIGRAARMTYSDVQGENGPVPLSSFVFDANYAVTAGPSFGSTTSADRPGVCPGDSGGPLYRGRPELNSDELVVGINSGRKPDQVVITSVNYHARVSSDLGFFDPTVNWLKGLIPADRIR